jgi:hypothetical protein
MSIAQRITAGTWPGGGVEGQTARDILGGRVSLATPFNGPGGGNVFPDGVRRFGWRQGNSNASISTAQSKFGGSSLLTNSGYLLTGEYPAPDSNSFTVEFWLNYNSIAGFIFGYYNGNGTGGGGPWHFNAATGGINFSINASITSLANTASNGTCTTGVWYHIAGVRDGNTNRLFVNGTQTGSGTVAGVLSGGSGHALSIGQYNTGNFANCYMQDVVISNYAKYTAAFTPPTVGLGQILANMGRP